MPFSVSSFPGTQAFGAGGEFRAPMAYAVIGGLLCSTVLSLVFVPAVFVVMDNVSRFLGRLGGRFLSKSEPEVRKDGSSLPSGH